MSVATCEKGVFYGCRFREKATTFILIVNSPFYVRAIFFVINLVQGFN